MLGNDMVCYVIVWYIVVWYVISLVWYSRVSNSIV